MLKHFNFSLSFIWTENSRASCMYRQCRQVACGCRCSGWQNGPNKEQPSSPLSSVKSCLLWRGRPHIWPINAAWTTDFYLLSANSLSPSNLYFYTCVIPYLYVFYTHSQSEHAAAAANLTLLIQFSLCAFTGAAEPWQQRTRWRWWLVCCLRGRVWARRGTTSWI